MSMRSLFWTLASDLCIFMPYDAYVLCSLQCLELIGIHLVSIKCIFMFLARGKQPFVKFTKMKRGGLPEYSVIWTVFSRSF